MNATMLSGGLRSGSIRPFARPFVEHQPRAVGVVAQKPEAEGGASLSVAERGGVWCVLDAYGAVLAPCASEEVANRHAVALASFFRPKS